MNTEAFDRLGEFQLYSGLRDFGTKTENPNMVLPEGRYAIVQPGDLFLVLRMNVLWPFYVGKHDRCFVRAAVACEWDGSMWRDQQIEMFLLDNVIAPAPDPDYHDTVAYKSILLLFYKQLRDKMREHLVIEEKRTLERERILEFL
jgi:hypothetical protein